MRAELEARIRYAKTSDGVAIAFWAAGEGLPLVHMPWSPWSHVQLEWQNPQFRRWYEALCASLTLIRYDGRSSGLSDRNSGPHEVDSYVRDLDAVVDRLQLERFALFAPFNMGPVGITYAARRAERVSGLVLWCAYAAGRDYYGKPEVQAIRALLQTDWDLYTETGAHSFLGWGEGEAAHTLAHLMRESSSPEEAKAFLETMTSADASPLLPRLQMPVLVMQRRELPLIDLDIARGLASDITDARLALFEGTSLAPSHGGDTSVAIAVAAFVSEGAADSSRTRAESEPGAAAAKATDGLTGREIEVLGLLAHGLSNREIADTLVLSPRTVERHIANIYAKINANNRVQATAYAFSHFQV
jgi:DNA-binding CsgD family transcriptional regulator/pimeloyl-ACP methyl ester carboxylesterase